MLRCSYSALRQPSFFTGLTPISLSYVHSRNIVIQRRAKHLKQQASYPINITTSNAAATSAVIKTQPQIVRFGHKRAVLHSRLISTYPNLSQCRRHFSTPFDIPVLIALGVGIVIWRNKKGSKLFIHYFVNGPTRIMTKLFSKR